MEGVNGQGRKIEAQLSVKGAWGEGQEPAVLSKNTRQGCKDREEDGAGAVKSIVES